MDGELYSISQKKRAKIISWKEAKTALKDQ
jgi:hypothetical protein